MSKYQRSVSNELFSLYPAIKILENSRPSWLITDRGERLELDFYFPELSVAIEVQGIQHYIYVPYFHKTYSEFQDQIRRDEEKRCICDKEGILLLEIYDDISKHSAFDKINQEWNNKLNSHLKDSFMFSKFSKSLRLITKYTKRGYKKLLRKELKRLQFLVESGGYKYIDLLPKLLSNTLGYYVKMYADVRVGYSSRSDSPYGTKYKLRIKNAMSRKVVCLHDSVWLVYGGNDVHILLGSGYDIICDCAKSKDFVDQLCCHVMAYYKTMFDEYIPRGSFIRWGIILNG